MVSLTEPKIKKTEFFRNPLQNSVGKALWVGLGVDLVVFFLLTCLMTGPLTAQFISFLAAVTVSFGIMAYTHHTAIDSGGRILWKMSGMCLALAVLFLRGGLMASLVQLLSFSYLAAYFITAPISLLVYVVAADHFLIDPVNRESRSEQIWPTLGLVLLVYSVLLRLFYIGLPEILHEEGYYWNYAQHLDLGYLDHPPLVGWVIWLSTFLFGDSEFALRLGAFLFWFVGGFYCYALTKRIFGSKVARDALLLYGLLPYFFGVSFVILPDSSLVACWAGSLYYVYRFVIDEKPAAAIGVGIFIGVGLLSKYSIVLIAAAAVIFLITDRRARRWLTRPEVYVAIDR